MLAAEKGTPSDLPCLRSSASGVPRVPYQISVLFPLSRKSPTNRAVCMTLFVLQGKAQASALGAQPNALLTVWNLQDLQSKGPVKYGDVLFLQMGRHEVSDG